MLRFDAVLYLQSDMDFGGADCEPGTLDYELFRSTAETAASQRFGKAS